MIYGIGTDIIEVERIRKACEKEAFCKKIYTENERKFIEGNAQRAAGNFAVKEAAVKAFGTGFGTIAPKDIEVLRESSGKPYVVLYGAARELAQQERICSVHVSISNLKELATAYVVMEREGFLL